MEATDAPGSFKYNPVKLKYGRIAGRGEVLQLQVSVLAEKIQQALHVTHQMFKTGEGQRLRSV